VEKMEINMLEVVGRKDKSKTIKIETEIKDIDLRELDYNNIELIEELYNRLEKKLNSIAKRYLYEKVISLENISPLATGRIFFVKTEKRTYIISENLQALDKNRLLITQFVSPLKNQAGD
jgi:hypothetical protein